MANAAIIYEFHEVKSIFWKKIKKIHQNLSFRNENQWEFGLIKIKPLTSYKCIQTKSHFVECMAIFHFVYVCVCYLSYISIHLNMSHTMKNAICCGSLT